MGSRGAARPSAGRYEVKWVLIVLGILLLILGVLWVLQGTNLIELGQMAGHRRWIAIGGLCGIIGIVLIIIGARLKGKKTA
jgi:uncharacterized integral membrane protein